MLEDRILADYRINLGQLSTAFAIKGSFTSEDDKFDPARHTLVVSCRNGDEGEEETIASDSYLEPPELNAGGTELAFRLVGGQWGTGDHTIHLRLEMVDAEGNPVSVDAGTFGFSGV